MLQSQRLIYEAMRMNAVCKHSFTARGGAERCQVTPASKDIGRLVQPTKRLSSKLKAAKLEYQNTASGLTMSGQSMAGLTDEQVQRFQRDGERSPSRNTGPQPITLELLQLKLARSRDSESYQ